MPESVLTRAVVIAAAMPLTVTCCGGGTGKLAWPPVSWRKASRITLSRLPLNWPPRHPRFERAVTAQRRENSRGAGRVITRADHVPEAERIGLIFLLAREAQHIEPRARSDDIRNAGAEDRADDLTEHP